MKTIGKIIPVLLILLFLFSGGIVYSATECTNPVSGDVAGANADGSCPSGWYETGQTTGTIGTQPGQTTGATGGNRLVNPLGGNTSTVDSFLLKLTRIAMDIGLPIAAIFIMWAGLKFVMAQGDTKAIDDAKKIFWYTIIGTAILISANLLANALKGTITQVFG